MKNNFRPVEFWKSAVMTMPDNSFFELLRSVFGKIKTPFKKQQLINDLESFLLREDIQHAITAYIDENDAKLIAAVALFDTPIPGELESFFSGELNFAQLQDIIVNLEERFIIYRFNEENKDRLALNPVLEQVLLPFIRDTSILFPAKPAGKNEAAPAVSNDRVFANDQITAGLLSFVFSFIEEPFFRGENVIRKKIMDAGKLCFPGIDLSLALGCLQILGLFYTDKDKLAPDKKRFDDFALLSARERSEYCAAALLVYTDNKTKQQIEILPPLYRGRVREYSNFIHSFFNSLGTELLYQEKSLVRLLEIFKSKTGVGLKSNELLDILKKTGLVIDCGDKLYQLGAVFQDAQAKHEGPIIANDSGFSIIAYPEISFADAISLASALSIREAGPVLRFELDKASAIRCFDKNINADTIIELLNRLSGGRIDESIIWTLNDWEKRHGEVSLKKGIVLTLAEEHRCLVETKALANLIRETIAPGIYLLPENAMEDAAYALQKAGIDIIARAHPTEMQNSARAFAASSHYPPLFTYESTRGFAEKIAPEKNAPGERQRDVHTSARFHSILKEMPLDKAARMELAARIDRRLILCETQLKEAVVRYEKLEARLLDYAGKQNIAKQALAQKSPLEIVWQGEQKIEKRIFGIPKALEKEEGELVLVIEPEESDESLTSVFRIPLAKISLLRRIKKSIFQV